MKLYNIYGKLVSKNVTKYAINWGGKSRSKLQYKVKHFLKPYWEKYIVYEEFPVYGTLMKVDILNASLKIAVEVHGPQHRDWHYFHNNSPATYLQSLKRDHQKYLWLEQNNFNVIEIMYNEVDTLSERFFKEKFNINL
jgi:hypothetical protein